ncbi:MAG: hypothetical protein LBC17_00060 [Lactobacillaceae bacterium]|jgi:hypothetical protein|nr:hypothetical protein [Lactobacillaceae bacterium]
MLWSKQFFIDYKTDEANISADFAQELTIKYILAIISTWLNQPVPESAENFSFKFLNILSKSPINISNIKIPLSEN